ncbi:MAG: hypothetical protein GF421_11205 [Candidatus Aminicenantes bacterium]|nr:hypothetical protein [Candidatus Aminicenantes bacterium]
MKKNQLCREVKAHLLDIVEQKLENLPHKEFLLSHVKSCPKCNHLVQEFSKLWNQLEYFPEIEPSSDFFNGVIQKIEKHERPKQIPQTILTRLRPVLKAVPATAFILFGMLIGSFLGDVRSEAKKDSSYEFVSEYFNNLDEIPSGSVADAYLNLDTRERRD